MIDYHYENQMLGFYRRIKKIIAPSAPSWPLGYFEVSDDIMAGWAKDLLQIKKMIVSLPDIVNITDFKSKYQLTTELYEAFLTVNQSLDTCFRPDCILTDEGLKVLEFNIDPGAMMVQSGVPPREALLAYMQFMKKNVEELDVLRKSYCADKEWADFLRAKSNGAKILLWDIPRGSENLGIRKEIQTVLLQAGVSTDFISGMEVSDFINSDSYKVFRMFSYPHLQSNSIIRSIFSSLTGDQKHFLGVRNLIFDSKINFAFLWSAEVQMRLNDAQKILVKKYVPETYLLNQKTYSDEFEKKLKNKDMWVLKAINSFQGQGVHIGKELMLADWLNLLSEKAHSGLYVIQKMQQMREFGIYWLGVGSEMPTVCESHLLNLFFVNDKFVGSSCRVNSSRALKVGAVDNTQTYALPVLIGKRFAAKEKNPGS